MQPSGAELIAPSHIAECLITTTVLPLAMEFLIASSCSQAHPLSAQTSNHGAGAYLATVWLAIEGSCFGGACRKRQEGQRPPIGLPPAL
mmetsp:Transcript_40260/g.93653  ORF Transcript_40260/g.93653 Transcript_40260/m.93653 type:complete len:89 (-) Transcript_40260:977-1243(-)